MPIKKQLNQKHLNILEAQSNEFLENIGLAAPYQPFKSKFKTATPGKVLILSDIHEPYCEQSKFDKVYENDGDCEICIVAGDIGDFYSKSRFRKTKFVSFKEELRAIFYRLEYLSIHYKEVYVMLGNHDNRPEKKFEDLLGENSDLLFLTEQNILKRLASYFDNIKIVSTTLKTNDHSFNVVLTHIWQWRDIIFTHAEISATQESRILERISQQLFRWQKEFGLKDYSVIMQGHNHTALKQFKGSEIWCLLPCMANSKSIGFGYIFNSKMMGNPPQSGYTTLINKNGITEKNSIHIKIF